MFNRSITERGHRILQEYIQKSDVVVDCTAGHGNDTLFLTECVGETGTVHAFEIQESALQELRAKFQNEPRVQIHPVSYEYISDYITTASVMMYNLGYLPGGDKRITTRTAETIRSLETACHLILPKGVISIVAYPGHPEGAKEAEAVSAFLAALPASQFEVLTLVQSNRSARTPIQHFVYRIR